MLKASVSAPSPPRAATNRRVSPILVGALVFACCAGCDAYRQQEIKIKQQEIKIQQDQEMHRVEETASTFLKSIPHSENPAKWGLEKSTLFGPGFVSASKQADSPLTYDAVAEVWCEGNTLEGHPVRLKRTVVMKVVWGQDSKWQVADYTLTSEEPLSYWKQATTCVVQGILVPLVIFSLWLFGLFVIAKFAEAVQWQWLTDLFGYTLLIGGFIMLSMWIKAPLQCFGSWVEVVLFWIISLSIVGFIALGIHKARKLS